MTASELITLLGLVVAGTITLVVLAFGTVGLFQARSLIRRELAAYFLSPIAYVVFAVFLAITGYLFYLTVAQLATSGPEGVENPFRFMYGDERFWLVFLFVPPVLTMRSFAEERASGTLEVLMTAPLRDWQLVLSKYIACLIFYVLLWVPTLAYLPLLLDVQVEAVRWETTSFALMTLGGALLTLVGFILLVPRLGTGGRLISLALLFGGIALASVGGYLHHEHDKDYLLELDWSSQIDGGAAVTLYIGMFLAGAMFLSLGLFISSLVRDQLVAALISMALSLVFIAAAFWRPDMDSGGTLERVVYFFSVPLHFHQVFTRGLLDTRHLILYGTVTVFFLFLTVRSLEARRWR